MQCENLEPEKAGWRLTFRDEFDGPALDAGRWYDHYRGGLVRYGRAHDVANPWFDAAPQAVYAIENGVLHLRMDESRPPRTPAGFAVSSLQTSDFEEDAAGRQVVRNKFAQKYGWFEIRCRMCSGSGLCSAFWLLQTDPLDQEFTLEHRRRGLGDGVVEIDIFEQLGKDNAAGLNWFNVHFTESGHREYSAGFELSREFHTWALEWKEGELIWYLDGRRVWTYKGETPKKEMGIFLSLYRGADEFRGAMDPGLTYPRDFEIDYVRVYERL